MAISPAAIAALCDDLRRWRDRIQSAINNDSLDWRSLVGEVFHEEDNNQDELLARLRMVENAGPLADAIDAELCDGWKYVSLNIGGNSWKVTDDGKRSVVSDLELSREYAKNVKRKVTSALAAVEQYRTDTLPKGNAKGRRSGKRGRPPNVSREDATMRRDWVARWKRWKEANPKIQNPMERFCKDETALDRPIDPPTLARYVNWVTQNRTRKAQRTR